MKHTTQHTPGPWTEIFGSREQGTSGAIIRDRIGIVAEVYPRNPSGTEQIANARLIAAAPDLLEALRYLVAADNDIQANRGGKHDQAMNRIAALDMAAAALTKAEGKV